MGLIGHNLPLIAWALLGACGLVAAWGMLWDRPRGRMRCRRCRYRMEGVPAVGDGTIICPECGRRHANAKSLIHAHRRWRLAVSGALVGLVGWYGLSFFWRFQERGAMGYVPTTVLVLLPQSAEAWFDSVDGRCPRRRSRRKSFVAPTPSACACGRRRCGCGTCADTRTSMRRETGSGGGCGRWICRGGRGNDTGAAVVCAAGSFTPTTDVSSALVMGPCN